MRNKLNKETKKAIDFNYQWLLRYNLLQLFHERTNRFTLH